MSDRRDLWRAALVWLVLVVIGELIVTQVNMLPPGLAAQAEEIDFAFNILLVYSVPVFAFVVTVLGYSIARWRVREPEGPDGDGVPIKDHKGFSWGWFVVTAGLAALLFTYPGLTGLLALAEEPEPDLVVEVEAVQWHWNIAYPELGLSMENAPEMVLPVGSTVRFDITSRDVIHSFWVPAFRIKQDAIPGQTTVAYVTLTETGTYGTNSSLRLQCAELCGTGHARMYIPIRVVSSEEFQAWISQMGGSGGMDMGGQGMSDQGMSDQGMSDQGMDMGEEG